jgi:hypothetical protein
LRNSIDSVFGQFNRNPPENSPYFSRFNPKTNEEGLRLWVHPNPPGVETPGYRLKPAKAG